LLKVTALHERGLVDAWNKSYPHEVILPGDRVLSVNGVQGQPDKMLQELQHGGTMLSRCIGGRWLSASDISFMFGRESCRMLCSALAWDRARLFGELEIGSGVDTARWWETDLTRTVLEWWYEDLHGRQPGTSPAVQALTRALLCAMRQF